MVIVKFLPPHIEVDCGCRRRGPRGGACRKPDVGAHRFAWERHKDGRTDGADSLAARESHDHGARRRPRAETGAWSGGLHPATEAAARPDQRLLGEVYHSSYLSSAFLYFGFFSHL